MNKVGLKNITFIMCVTSILGGCHLQNKMAHPFIQPTDNQSVSASDGLSPYYYFLETELHLKKGALQDAIYYLKKTIDLDPESLLLKRKLAILYLRNKENEKSYQLMEQLVTAHPENVENLILFGRIKQLLKREEGLPEIYERILAIDPAQKSYYLLLGRIYLDNNLKDKALEIFKQYVANFPDDYTAHFYLGKYYVEEKQFDLAEKTYQKALDLKPDIVEIRLALIYIHKQLGRTQAVIKGYEDIIQRYPENGLAKIELGLFFHEKGMKEKAATLFAEIGKESLSNPLILRNIIQIFLDKKKFKDVVITLEGMLKGAPGNMDIYYALGVAFHGMEDMDKALAYFQKISPDSNYYIKSIIHRGVIHENRGETKKAIEILKTVYQKNPDHLELIYYLGSFYEEDKNYLKAEEIFLAGIEKDARNAKILFRLGVVYDKWGKKEESINVMLKVIEIEPNNANALNYLGYTYAEMGENLDEAESLIKSAIKYKPNDGYITDSLGWVYYKKGALEKAVTTLEKAVNLVPDDPILLEHLGDAYFKANQLEKALDAYKRSLLHKEPNEDFASIKNKIDAIKGKMQVNE